VETLKLTLLGGAGVRVPLMVQGLIHWQKDVQIDKLVLYDLNAEKLDTIGKLVTHIVQKEGAPFEVEITSDLRKAIKDSDFIYTAIRVGNEKGRVIDERVALKHGVLGQETTGAGGFSMALRTIPVMLDLAKVIEELAPNAWVINFTNPSGLITEALLKHTSLKVIGICDAPSSMKIGISKFLQKNDDHVFIDYFGLNHLGWIKKVMVQGENHLPKVIENYNDFVQKFPHMGAFSEDLIKTLNLLPNEYLYYYFYRDQAVANITNSANTRGEQIVQLNETLIKQLKPKVNNGDLAGALNIYKAILDQRNNSYMSAETGSTTEEATNSVSTEGYDGLAMSILSSIVNNKDKQLILNVKNNSTIPELNDDDVIEVTCLLNQNGPVPLAVGKTPPEVKGLLTTVKEYERLTIEAAVTGNYEKGVLALTIHPLVNSHTLAKKIVDDYIVQHQEFLPLFQNRSESYV
jgi:6-phospho-beta-glucosidase